MTKHVGYVRKSGFGPFEKVMMKSETKSLCGVFANSREEYDIDSTPTPSLTQSIAKVLVDETPLHAWHECRRLNPDWQEKSEDKFAIGSAAHALLFEGKKPYVCNFEDWRTKEAKAARDTALAHGQIPLLSYQSKNVCLMVQKACDEIDKATDFKVNYRAGSKESTVIWQPDNHDIYCRSRLDFFDKDAGIILDYKTTTTAKPSKWLRTGLGNGIDIQAAFYLRAMKTIYPEIDWSFIFVVQEVTPPFVVSFVSPSPEMLEMGNQKIEYAMQTWASCIKANDWPAYGRHVHTPEMPAYIMTEWANDSFGRLPSGDLTDKPVASRRTYE